MAAVNPPLFQTLDGQYDGAELGAPYRDAFKEGVVASGDLLVTERSAGGANGSVDVAAGVVWVRGDDSALQPTYRCYNDATVNLSVAPGDATNPRIDRVIAEVRDDAFSGVANDWRIRVMTGTPAGSPVAPTLPNNAHSLATISVPALDTVITNAQITDTRHRLQLGEVPVVTSLPVNPYDGQEIDYVADAANGVVWRFKYRSASGSAYKWEFVGGPALRALVSTLEGRNNAAFGALATAGPSVTVPLAGDYDVQVGSRMQAGSGSVAVHSYAVGGTGAADADAAVVATAGGDSSCVSAVTRKTGVAAAAAIVSQYRNSGPSTCNYLNRWMAVFPVRVG